jgi:hypothetical protein
MRTHEQVLSKLLRRPGVRKEVHRIEREDGELLDQLLKARPDPIDSVAIDDGACGGRAGSSSVRLEQVDISNKA